MLDSPSNYSYVTLLEEAQAKVAELEESNQLFKEIIRLYGELVARKHEMILKQRDELHICFNTIEEATKYIKKTNPNINTQN